jgi:hypothetical protein
MVMTEVSPINRINADIEERKLGTLGYLVWWSLGGVEILQSDFATLVDNLGFVAKDIAPQIEARGALKKALDEIDTPFFIRRLADTDDCVAMALVRQDVRFDTAGIDANFAPEQIVTYYRASKTISCSTTYRQMEIEAAFTKYCLTYRANEVRIAIMRVLQMANAITVRESGGIYFVPEAGKPILDKLTALAAAVPGVQLVTLGIVDTAESKAPMAVAAGDEIRKTLETAAQDLTALVQRKQDGTKVRDATLEKRLADFQAIREKAMCYKDLVSLDIQDIEAGIKNLEDIVSSLF